MNRAIYAGLRRPTRPELRRRATRWIAFSSGAVVSALLGISVAFADEPAAGPPSPPSVLSQGNSHGSDSLDALGPRFESTSAGISISPPAACQLVNRLDSKYVAEWANAKLNWRLSLARITPPEARSLTDGRNNFGTPVHGLLEETVAHLQSGIPGCKILRQDVTNISEGGVIDRHHPELEKPNVGLIALRYSQGTQHFLSQQALIQANERLYYLLTFTTPGLAPNADAGDDDAGERAAVSLFSSMLDSVRLLDGQAIRQDQNARLYRTRSLLVNLIPSKMHAVLIKEQWLRYIRDGKDIGYSYITEETAAGIPRPLTRDEIQSGKSERDLVKPGEGILVGIRSRMIADAVRADHTRGPIQTDSANWFFVTADRKNEEWSRLVIFTDDTAKQKDYLQEIGSSDKRIAPKVMRMNNDDGGALGQFNADSKSWIEVHDDYNLDVNLRTSHESPEPITRKLPPWYLPQAVAQLLPRLVPLNRPSGYLFATYVPDLREVMMRYVDVMPEQKVTFAGQTVRAVPIHDRLGLDGSMTIHYMSPEGAYLGSENKDQKLVVLPSDSATLTNIWKNPNLTRPEGIQPKANVPGRVPQLSNATREEPSPSLVNPVGPNPNQGQ